MKTDGVTLSTTDCHVLWKYLAYGIIISEIENEVSREERPKQLTFGGCDEVDIESDEVCHVADLFLYRVTIYICTPLYFVSACITIPYLAFLFLPHML
jgi:hypothetical protein